MSRHMMTHGSNTILWDRPGRFKIGKKQWPIAWICGTPKTIQFGRLVWWTTNSFWKGLADICLILSVTRINLFGFLLANKLGPFYNLQITPRLQHLLRFGCSIGWRSFNDGWLLSTWLATRLYIYGYMTLPLFKGKAGNIEKKLV